LALLTTNTQMLDILNTKVTKVSRKKTQESHECNVGPKTMGGGRCFAPKKGLIGIKCLNAYAMLERKSKIFLQDSIGSQLS
jgi:hypothetical protein